MKYFARITMFVSGLFACMTLAAAEPDYVYIEMEIDVDRSAEATWAAVGDYCAIQDWSPLGCEITSGGGKMGTVRSLSAGPRTIIEILVAQTELSYGYTQPVQEGQFYDLYHGFMEARPVTADTSKIMYTLVYDASNMSAEEKEADMARRRGAFEGFLQNMKNIAESQ